MPNRCFFDRSSVAASPSKSGGGEAEAASCTGDRRAVGPTAPGLAPSRIVHSLREALQPDEAIRVIDASHDLDFPPIPFPSLRVLRIAGEPMLRKLVLRHHELMRQSSIGDLFPADREQFMILVHKAGEFVVEACGGPDRYSAQFGTTCMRTRHLPFSIDEDGRHTWLRALWQAFDEVAFPDDVREEYWNWVEAMSIRMITRRRMRTQPPRYPYAQMRAVPGSRDSGVAPP